MHRTVVVVGTAALLAGVTAGLFATSPTARATTGAIGLNEVESQPRGGAAGGDWVELVNVTDQLLSIGGWQVRDLAGNTFTVPAGNALLPGAYYVLEMGSVLDAEDMAILIDSNGTQVDWFHWLTPAVGTWSRCVEGTGNFLDSTPTKGTANPCRGPHITASLSSAKPISTYGWFKTPVTVSYTCTAGNAPVVSCSLPQMLVGSLADLKAVGSVEDANGAGDRIEVRVSIDQVDPLVAIKGIKKGKWYATKQSPTVKAFDMLSGFSKAQKKKKKKVVQEVLVKLPQGTKWLVKTKVCDRAGNCASAKTYYWVWSGQDFPDPDERAVVR